MTTALVAFLHPADRVSPQFRRSLTFVLMRDAARAAVEGQKPRFLGEIDRESSANISQGRCSVVQEFLTHPRSPDWLWLVDADMTFPETIFERLLMSADPVERPIVGGLCFGVRPKRLGDSEWFNETWGTPLDVFPTMYMLDEHGGMHQCVTYPPDTLVPVATTGAACLLIHRSVLADERWREDGHPLPWFRESVVNGKHCSEDQFFCLKAGAFGYPVVVDTGARTGHVKNVVVDEDMFLRQYVAPPAAERVTVIVPVLNRPQNAEPFMRSLRASTGLADVIVVNEPGDDASLDAWIDAHARVEEFEGKHTFAEKVNAGYRAPTADAPWVFIVGDDVRFHAGWLDQAQHIANLTGASVIGTNDLGSPRVMRGDWSPHLLIRRSYIDENGASWGEDGNGTPGEICHEGYAHNFVDDEIVEVAKQRGVWTPALGSIVEHLHPLWHKRMDDPTYLLGHSSQGKDYARFRNRKKRFGGTRVPA